MNILLAIDGSEDATAAGAFLCRFPLPPESRVTLITVFDKSLFSTEDDQPGSDQQSSLSSIKTSIDRETEKRLARDADGLEQAGLQVTTEIATGHPAEIILKRSYELQVDLIVLGSKGLTGIKHFLLGSVSEKVLQHAHCSVLIVKQKEEENVGTDKQNLRILLAYDNSDSARNSVHFCSLLPLTDKDEVTILTAIPLITIYRQDIRQHISKIWHQRKDTAQASLEKVVSDSAFTTPLVSTRLIEGSDTSEVILETIKELNCNLVVLGNKGKSGIKKFFLGSVTEKVSKYAECAVLVVRS